MEYNRNIQWFPGHMSKTRREIAESLGMTDVVAEICDARIAVSSRNPELDGIIKDKPRLIILNKRDLADPAVTEAWLSRISRNGAAAIAANCETGDGLERFSELIRGLAAEKLRRDASRGMTRAVRIMVVGVPNSGKSSLINRVAGGKRTKVENRPGVTVRRQWIRFGSGLELLDTPGVLWPKFDDRETGFMLAFTGAVKDAVLDLPELACELLPRIWRDYPEQLSMRFNINLPPGADGLKLLETVSEKRGFLLRGGEIDYERAARCVLDEFRSGKLGRISLEKQPEA